MSVTPTGWPTITLEVGFSSNPSTAIGSTTWTDITAYLRSFSTHRGRQYELDRFEAGTATFVLDNRDRRFDPTYTSSPYSPNVLPMRRVRLRATYNSTTYDVWSGFVEAWEQSYPTQAAANKGDAVVEMRCVDGFKVLANSFLSRSVYEIEVRADSPTHWWRLGEQAPSTAAGNQITPGQTGVIQSGVELGADGLLALDDTTSYSFVNSVPPNNLATTKVRLTTGPATSPFSVEGWFVMTEAMDGGELGAVLWWQDQGVSTGLTIYVNNNAGNEGKFNVNIVDRSGNQAYANSGSALVNDGLIHHFVCTLTGTTLKIYLDGVDVTSGATTSGTVGTLANTIAFIGNDSSDSGGVGFPGRIQDVAVYGGALSSARVAAHYNAGHAPWSGDLSSARLTRVLDEIDWPSADRTIGTGISTLQATKLDGQSALAYGQTIDQTENGALYMGRDGKVVFRSRHYPLTTTAATTSQATFGDGGGSELPYRDLVLSYDDSLIKNKVTVAREGGAKQTAEDATSQSTYLLRSHERTGLLHNSDLESLNAAEWLVAHYKDADLRVEQIEVLPDAARTTLFPQVLGRDIWDRVTVKRRPPGTGTITKEVLVEGVEHSVSIGPKSWVTRWRLSPAETQSYWILGTSALGTDTRVAY